MRATSKSKWHLFPSSSEVAKRAGGRRRYNAQRQEQALARCIVILELLGASVILNPRGVQARIARHFGVNRSTTCRDIAAIRAEWRHQHMCYVCERYSDLSFGTQAKLAQKLNPGDSSPKLSCCVRGFLQREADRPKRRATTQELQFRRMIERL